MRSVRLIPCLDVTGGRVVKGVRFVDLTDEGDPVELAARYDAEGADEVTFLDITASSDGRDTMVSVVARTAEQVFIPLTVGGGVRAAEDGAASSGPGGQGRGEHRRGRTSRPWCVPSRMSSAASAPSWPSMPEPAATARAGGRSIRTVGGPRSAATWWPGPSSARPTAPARSC